MKKLTLMAFLLAILAPVTQVWAGSTYYYKMHLKVSSNSTGKGLVYAKDDTTELPSGATFVEETTVTHSRYDNKSVNTGSAFAKANYGYVFKGWSSADNSKTYVSTANPYTPVVSSSATSAAGASTTSYYAVFETNPNSYTLTINNPEGLASYTVTAPSGFPTDLSHGGTATVYNGDQYTFKYNLSSDEYDFINWTVNGDVKTTASITVTISAATTINLTLKKKVTYYATCQAAAGGTYKANSTTVLGSDQTISNFGSVTVSLSDPVANTGYAFYGWYIQHSNGVKEYLSYYTSASTGEKKENITVGAEFREVQDCTVNFAAPAEGKITYSISGGNSGEVDDADKSETVLAGANVTLTATSDFESRRAKWYTRNESNEKVYFSIDSTLTKTFASSVTLGVDFVPVNTNIMNAIEAALSHETHEAVLAADAEIVLDTSVEIPSGITIDLNGHTLYVDGTLTVNGTLTGGTVSKCLKVVKQTGVDGMLPINPYGSVKYWKTEKAVSSSASITGYSTSNTHLTVMRGDGVAVRGAITSSTKLVKCTFDGTVAVNHVTAIGAASDTADISENLSYILLADVTINGPVVTEKSSNSTYTRIRNSATIDCAGWSCTMGTKQISSSNSSKVLNAPTFTYSGDYWQNGAATFYNCPSISIKPVKNTPPFYLYDSGATQLTFTQNSSGTAKCFFYSGKFDTDLSGNGPAWINSESKIYGGGFKTKPATKWIESTKQSTHTFTQHSDGYWYLDVNQDPSVAKIGGAKYLTITEALAYLNDNDSATITLLRDVSLDSPYTLAAGKSLVIELGGCHIDAPNGFIKNYGSLSIRNHNNSLAVSGVTVGSGNNVVENYDNGTVDICYGLYEGNFVVNDGTFTTHHGKFIGSVVNNGGTMNLKGGIFSSNISSLMNEGYHAFLYGGWYYVGRFPKPEEGSSSIASFARVLTAMPTADKTLYLAKKTYSLESCSNADEWKYVAELKAAYSLYADEFCIDILVGFDRDVAADTCQGTVNTKLGPRSENISKMDAGNMVRIFSPRITQNQISYTRFIYDNGEGNYDTMEAGISDINNANKGTTCTLAMDLWKYHDKTKTTMDSYLTIISVPYVFGAGNNVAMLQTAAGAVPDENFFATLAAAIDSEATKGQTIKLCNDCSEGVTVGKACTFKIDPNGFDFTDNIVVAEESGLTLEKNVAANGVIEYVVSAPVTDAIESSDGTKYTTIEEVVAAATENAAASAPVEVTVTITETTSEQAVELPQNATLTVVQQEGVETTVTVTPTEGHFVKETVVESAGGQSGTTTVYESKKITEAVTPVTVEALSSNELEITVETKVKDEETTTSVEDDAEIVAVVASLMENAALECADNTEAEQFAELDAIVITPKAIVQEAATVTSTPVVKSATFDVTPKDKKGNKINGAEFVFRLPVDTSATEAFASIFHEGVFAGHSSVRTEKGCKFVEIVASNFSEYSYSLRDSLPSVAKIGDDSFVSLEDAFAAACVGATITLIDNTTLTNEIAVAKAVTLNLGEFTVTAASGKSAIQVVAGGNLTVAATTGGITSASAYAIYTDYELSQGVKSVTINGGTFSSVQFNKYPIQTSAVQSGEAATPTTVTVNGGTFNGNFKVYHCPTMIAGGKFEKGLDTSVNSVSVYANYKTPVTITGGQFKTEPVNFGSRVIVGAGYYQGGYFVVGNTSACEVKRNGKFYLYATEAFAAVGADTRIEILKPESVSEIAVTIGEGQSLTVPSSFAAVSAASGLTLETTPNTADGTVTYTARAAGKVAKIGGTYYETLDAAFAAAVSGDTITLVADATLGITALSAEVTLALAEHGVTVATEGIDLSSGKLTVTGVGLVSAIPTVTKKGNLVIVGGTWGANPSAYVPEIVTALPNEQADAGWRKDRYYVFDGKAFVGGEWGDAPGCWTVVPLPKAYVTPMEESEKPSIGTYGPLDCAYTFESFSSENGDDAIAATFLSGGFNAFSNPVQLARAKELLMEKMPFLDWDADFVVSLDRNAAAGDLALSGYYEDWGLWVTYESPDAVAAGRKIRLLTDIGRATPGDWPYENICRYVRTFKCGANMINPALAGTTMTVQLRLYKPGTDEGLGSPSILVCEYKYTFGGYAAKIGTNLYATMAEAFGAVAANDVVTALNDFSGDIDLTDCDKPFTVDVNGFGFKTNAVTVKSGWTFKQLSNRNCSYYAVPEEENVAMVEVVADNGETVTLAPVTIDEESTFYTEVVAEAQSTETTVEEVLAQTDANGLQKWQNYVLGQTPTEAVIVDAEQTSNVAEMPVVNTLAVSVPENSGFTVKYEIDQVSANGDVVEEGEQEDSANADFNIDLTKVVTNAYFKMTAVIESTDGTGAKTKVSSENTIGVLVVSNGANTVAIAVPWASYDGTGAISVSNLVRTANLTPGDTLQAYDSESKKYKSWKLTADKTWEPQTVAGGSGKTAADAYTVARGSAVWLTRADTTQPIYLVGGAAEASGKVETKLEAAPSETKSSWNLVGSPTVEPVDVSTILEGKDGDKVVVPTAGAPKNYEYVEGKGWGYWTTETVTLKNGRKAVKSVFRTDDTYVPAGTGFWYLNSSTGSDSKIEW